MISSAKATAPVSNNAPGASVPAASEGSGTPFDAILALETVAATPTAVAAAATDLGAGAPGIGDPVRDTTIEFRVTG